MQPVLLFMAISAWIHVSWNLQLVHSPSF